MYEHVFFQISSKKLLSTWNPNSWNPKYHFHLTSNCLVGLSE